jgi:hypothetical protein
VEQVPQIKGFEKKNIFHALHKVCCDKSRLHAQHRSILTTDARLMNYDAHPSLSANLGLVFEQNEPLSSREEI